MADKGGIVRDGFVFWAIRLLLKMGCNVNRGYLWGAWELV
jgi:hypothetical protein